MNTRLYWTIKNFFQKIVFDTKRLIYVLKEKFSKQCNLLHIQFDILKVVLWQIFLAIVFVLLLKKCDALLLSYLKLDSVSLDMFKDITIGGMGIAGVILGLYCANISSIFSAKYSNVPSDLATLYQRDVITNSCINQIIRYIVVCSIFLFECVFEQPLGIASIIVLLFLTVQMVITFSVTGNRSYMLSDTFSVGDWYGRNNHNQFMDDFYLLWRTAKFKEFKREILDYLLRKINTALLPYRNIANFSGEIITHCKESNYSQDFDRLQKGDLTISQFSNKLYHSK